MKLPQDADVLAKMIDTVGVGVGMYDADGVFLYVNSSYAEMLGTDREEFVGTHIWEVNPELDADGFDSYWESFADGETRFAETVHEYDGTRIEVGTATTQIRVGGEVYHIGTIRDISLQKERERQLGQLHSVTQNLMEGDTRQEIADVTARTAETILGYESSVVRFAEDGQLRPVSVTEQAQEAMGERPNYPVDGDSPAAKTYRDGDPTLFEDISQLDDEYDRGDSRAVMYVPLGEYGVLSIAAPVDGVFDQTDVYLASILTSTTVTALNRLENERSLERQNQRLEAFYDVITHDIPNHLNVAQTRLDIAIQNETLEHLDHVSTAHDRIEAVINDMRALVEQGEQIDETESHQLSTVVRACWGRSQPEDSNATLAVESDGTLQADESRLKQLLENLFWNAVDHAGEDATVWVGMCDGGFYVEDDGPGIPEEEREQVLSPGYTTADDHSGFGLAIVRAIAQAHDWEVAITDGRDGGARFEFTGVATR